MHTTERTLVSFDWAMKRILRDKANFDVLEGFLSALLGEEIQVIDLLESEANQNGEGDKFNRVDLRVKDARNVEFIIEVQYSYAPHFLKRLLFGTAKLITDSAEAGDSYEKVKKVISISLLYFLLGEKSPARDYVYHGGTEFYGLHTGQRLAVPQDTLRCAEASVAEESDRQTKANVFPEYYLIDIENFPDQVKDGLDEWIYFFKHSEIPDRFVAKNIQTARQKLDWMKMDREERAAYERFAMARASYQDEIQSAKDEGRKEGLEEGAHTKAIEIATTLKRQGVAVALIVLATGLREDEVTGLG